MRISFREILLRNGNCLNALTTALDAFCKVETAGRAILVEAVGGGNDFVTEESVRLKSLLRRNRTVVVQHWLRGNDRKPLEEQELKSS